MHKPVLSIVIPTHKRSDILLKCLEHIENQTIAKQLEVIVVSDGHDQKTADVMNHIEQTEHGAHPSLAGFTFVEIPKSQQGVARNRGVKHAHAERTLFIGDDILLAPDACEKHLVARTSKPAALLGFTTWDPASHITDVMRWLETSGWQFGYPMIAQYAHKPIPSDIQHRFTYTSHISLPTEIAKKFPFREDVTMYGWEDILWGTALRDAGVALIYEPDAKALHHHHIELADSLKRMETLGESLRIMEKIDPTFDRIPKGWKLWAHRAIALLPTMRGKHEQAFLRGLKHHN